MKAVEDHKHRRRVYNNVLGIVKCNTGNGQPPLLAKHTLRVHAGNAGLDQTEVTKAVRAAIQNDELLDWHGQLALVTEKDLNDVIKAEVESDTPRKQLIGRCNQLLDDLREAEQ